MATATKSTANVAKFKLKSSINLITFLKRFSSLEKNLLLEMTRDNLLAKSYTGDKAIVKYSKLALGDVLEGDVPADLVKIAIFDISKVTNVFDHFSKADEISLDVKYEVISGEYVATELLFHTKALRIKVECADLSLFTYIQPEMIKRIVKSAADDKVLDFPFPKDAFVKINSLCKIDYVKDFLTIKIHDNKIIFKGKSFEYEVGTVQDQVDMDFAILNEHFSMIEQEISTFVLGPQKLLVKSQESDTLIIVGRVD